MTSPRSQWPRWARLLTSPWLVSPVLVIALLFAAFAGYGAYTRSQPTHYSRGGQFGVPAAAPTGGGTPVAAGAVQNATPASSPSARAASTPTAPSRALTTTGAANRGAAAHRDTIGAPPASPRAGTYTLAVSGSEHVKFGPFSACTNTFPAQSTLAVSRATDEPGGSYDFDQRYYPNSPSQHDERHIYRYSANTVLLTYEAATVTCAGVKQSTTVNFDPAQIRLQLPLRIGASWHSHGGDSGRTEDATGKVVGTDHVTIAGRSYLTYVIDTHVTMSGSETGTRDQRWWWSPALAIAIKWQESLSGSRSGASYSEDVTCTVTDLPAAH